jgi:hypothetical protein
MFLFMGRFMNVNYAGYLFALMLLTYFMAETPLSQEAGGRR